jgi:pSer/pThr/pTyr-binding forkhead associated (FHA) protein
LEIAPPQCFLRDLGSTNGTFVNGIRVETAHLRNGDRIQGGETVLKSKFRSSSRKSARQFRNICRKPNLRWSRFNA